MTALTSKYSYMPIPGVNINQENAEKLAAFLEKKFPTNEFTAQQVLDAARPTDSPIHDFFEWNDSVAAEKWRVNQARTYVSCLIVNVNNTTSKMYHSLRVEDGKRYVHTEKARSQQDLWDQVLQQAIREANSWRDRYRRYSELSPVFQAIELVAVKK